MTTTRSLPSTPAIDTCNRPDTAPNRPKQAVDDSWWDAQISNRLAAAYQAGRLLAQLRWHLTQILFGVSPEDDTMVDEVTKRIVAASFRLVRKPPNQLGETITDVVNRAKADLSSEAAADDAYMCSEEAGPASILGSRAERREEVVESWIGTPLRTLHDNIYGELTEMEQWAMELGRYIDEGVRCPDVGRQIDLRRESQRSQQVVEIAEIGGLLSHGENRRAPQTKKTEKRPPNAVHEFCTSGLVRRAFQPGDLPPEDAWLFNLKGVLERLGLPAGAYEEVLAQGKHAAHEGRPDGLVPTLERLDQIVRQHLSALAAEDLDGHHGEVQEQLPIIDNNPRSPAITWEGTRYPVNHDTIDAFEAMIGAKGQPVGLGQYVRKPNEWLKKLQRDAPALAAIVARADGNRGYRLTIFDRPNISA